MNAPTRLVTGSLTTAGLFLGYVASLQAGEVGPMAYVPPAPVSDCDACNDPGPYGSLSLLYLKPYGTDGFEGDGDWDLGARGTLGFERPDGLFYELNGFWYEGEFDPEDSRSSDYQSEISHWYIEGLIGDNLHCGEACLDLAFGLRYAQIDDDRRRVSIKSGTPPPGNGVSIIRADHFEGFGPVVRLDGTRTLTDQVTLYGGLSQAILFGELDRRRSQSADTVVPVTEIELGLQFNFNMGAIQGAHARLGLEAQYWSMPYDDFGLIGGVLGVGFNF
ncbi:MAG: hypothetical protein HKN82_06910 [Akkermansiaceae bacterium]|nr:hypothetical protein [Akkermansiaceae bacterium]NNM28662.1 hypothetical protein [Akkermansiaceae bacterium]